MEGLLLACAGGVFVTLVVVLWLVLGAGAHPPAEEYPASDPAVYMRCPVCFYRTQDRQTLSRLPEGLWCGTCMARMFPDE